MTDLLWIYLLIWAQRGLCHLKMVVSITPNGQVCAGVILSPIIPNFVKLCQILLGFRLVDKIWWSQESLYFHNKWKKANEQLSDSVVYLRTIWHRVSSVVVVTRLQPGRPRNRDLNSGMCKGFFFPEASKLPVGPTQSNIQWLMGYFLEVKAAGRRSRWPCGLRLRPKAPRLLGLRVRISLRP
jgi:hypothetical protein